MRLLPIFPALCSLAACVLAFLVLFAGNKPNFMEDYAVLTLNTSRIGQNFLQSSSGGSSGSGSNTITSWLHNITSQATSTIKGDISSLETSFARSIGLEDFYSAHLLDYCEGFFTPGPLPNATLPRKAIHKNVTYCSNHTAMFTFDPNAALQATLNKTGTGITLEDLHWPGQIESGIRDLRFAVRAAFVLYCVAIGLCFVSFILCLFWMSRCSTGGKGIAAIVILLAFLAFFSLGCSSAIMTVIAVKGTDVINEYGKEIGVSGNWGAKFQALTWAATGLMLVATVGSCFGCCLHRNREHVKGYGGEKYRA